MDRIVVLRNLDQKNKRMRKILLLALIVGVSFDSIAQSNRFEAGIAAMKRGRFAVAYRSWLPLAEAGMPEAQLNLGSLFQNGQGVDVDLERALYWYEQAAASDLSEAHLNSGIMYLEGLGTEKNEEKALEKFKLSSERGLPAGDLMLGKMLFYGLSVEQDKTAARALFLKAARKGYAEAQFAYAVLAQSGQGAIAPKQIFLMPEKRDLGDPLVAFVWANLAWINGYRSNDVIQLYEVSEIMLNDRVEGLEKTITKCLESQYVDCPIAE